MSKDIFKALLLSFSVAILIQYVQTTTESRPDMARCFASDVETHDLTMLDLTRSNLTSEEPAFPEQNMALRLCPDSSSLQITWFMNTTKTEFTLCYLLRAVYDWRLLGAYCYKLQLNTRANLVHMTCWFQNLGEDIKRMPSIFAWTHGINPDEYSGSLDTAILTDINQSCTEDRNVCQILTIDLHNVALCRNKVKFHHDKVIKIQRLIFSATKDPECKDKVLPYTQLEPGVGQFFLNCGFDGPASLNIIYDVKDVFCRQMIKRMSCYEGIKDIGTTKTLPVTLSPHTMSTKVLVTLVLACVVCAVVIVIAIFCVIRIRKRPDIERNRQTAASSGEDHPLDPNRNNANHFCLQHNVYGP